MISEQNKRYLVTISKADYDKLEQIAKKENRSVSRQSLQFIQEGMAKYSEGKKG